MSVKEELDTIHGAAYRHEQYVEHISGFFSQLNRAAGNERIREYIEVGSGDDQSMGISFLGRVYRVNTDISSRHLSKDVRLIFSRVVFQDNTEVEIEMSSVSMNTNGLVYSEAEDLEQFRATDTSKISRLLVSWLATACNA
jgi:hypothetical protein